VIYLDSSALVKLIVEETGSEALDGWLSARAGVPRLSSELSRVEVIRACRRRDDGLLPAARQLLAGLDIVPITAEILEQAAVVGPSLLRSLDAIHLASALALGAELSAFVAYDGRLEAAAASEQLPVVAPS
jgi:uncharacterized protein